MSKAVRAALVVSLAVVAACSGGGKQAEAPTTTSTRPPTTQAPPTTISQEEQIEAAYLAYWQMVDRLVQKPDPHDPELELRALDPVLASIRDSLTTDATNGTTTRVPSDGTYSHRIDQASVSGDTASITDCFVDGRIQIDAVGVVVNSNVVTKQTVAVLARQDGDWKVSDVRFMQKSAGVSGCAS